MKAIYPKKATTTARKRVAEIIKEMSRLKYGKDVRLVEAEIARRSGF